MELLLQLAVALFAIALAWLGIRQLLRAMTGYLPGTSAEPHSNVPSPLKPRQPQLSGAVGVEEPEDESLWTLAIGRR